MFVSCVTQYVLFVTQYHELSSINNEYSFSHSSGGQEPEIKVSAGPCPSSWLPLVPEIVGAAWPAAASRHVTFLLLSGHHSLDEGPPRWPHLDSTASARTYFQIKPHSQVPEVRIWTFILGGHSWTHSTITVHESRNIKHECFISSLTSSVLYSVVEAGDPLA